MGVVVAYKRYSDMYFSVRVSGWRSILPIVTVQNDRKIMVLGGTLDASQDVGEPAKVLPAEKTFQVYSSRDDLNLFR